MSTAPQKIPQTRLPIWGRYPAGVYPVQPGKMYVISGFPAPFLEQNPGAVVLRAVVPLPSEVFSIGL